LSQLFETNTTARTSAAAFTVRNCREKASYGHNTSGYHINRTHHDSTGYADLGRQYQNHNRFGDSPWSGSGRSLRWGFSRCWSRFSSGWRESLRNAHVTT
jgi:hypothetical protein